MRITSTITLFRLIKIEHNLSQRRIFQITIVPDVSEVIWNFISPFGHKTIVF